MEPNEDSNVPDERKIFQNSIEYLHRISSFLKVPALKTIFNTKSRLMELRTGILLPPNMTKASVKCQRCLLNFQDGPAKYSIKKAQKLQRFARKIKSKEQKGKPLTAYQRRFFKKFKYHEGNMLIIKCKFCDKQASIQLQKPVKEKTISLITPKKKKKRKDKSAGLNQEVLRNFVSKRQDSVIVLDDSIRESSQNKSVIVIEDSFAKTPKKVNITNTSRSKKSVLQKSSSSTPKNSHKSIISKRSILKDSPRLPPIKKNVLKGKIKKKLNKKMIETKEAKKKKKNLSKLGSLLKDTNKKSPSSSLNHFLQCL
ncbi:unnamed protein product [Acanthoscelides obtectus]|uniref:Uncharacterized protein n=1 Tax=Acanthoscelides obtectus TaxID=200917 RepID=A0A9P0LTP7_ACAOB|nr:unnamed protein product [Acanthoscelides obtectus]CAK1667095.1 hypothetical protein AOBTE_LOCUS25679 [Acanthoscelides obtectus]